MTARQARLALQIPNFKLPSGRKRLRAHDSLSFTDKRRGLRLLPQPVEIEDVIAVTVSEQDQLDRQPVVRCELQHPVTVRSGIVRGCALRLRIKHEVGVHGHVRVRCVEAGEAIDRARVARIPRLLCAGD